MGSSANMTNARYAFVHRFEDRHGKVRHYFRRPGYKRHPLPGCYGSPEFVAAYAAALAGNMLEVGVSQVKPRSLDALAVAYYQSSAFKQLRASTQSVRRNALERLRKEYGDAPIALLTAQNVRGMLDDRVTTPSAGNNLLKLLRQLLKLAVQLGWRDDNPTRDVERLKEKVGGHTTWSERDIAAFEARWPPGTRERLALALLLTTGQRRGDVVRLSCQHINGPAIELTQQKTGTRVRIPILPELQTEIDRLPKEQPAFLVTQQGKPFSAAGFTNWFVECAEKAGLPAGLTPHGLRKTCATRLANQGCTTHEIAAVTGHSSLKEVERYTRAVSQATLAEAAFKRRRAGSER